eukprot:14681930-Heterocapsa_arctica.AAC.1
MPYFQASSWGIPVTSASLAPPLPAAGAPSAIPFPELAARGSLSTVLPWSPAAADPPAPPSA